MARLGHEKRFPPPRLRGGCRFKNGPRSGWYAEAIWRRSKDGIGNMTERNVISQSGKRG